MEMPWSCWERLGSFFVLSSKGVQGSLLLLKCLNRERKSQAGVGSDVEWFSEPPLLPAFYRSAAP